VPFFLERLLQLIGRGLGDFPIGHETLDGLGDTRLGHHVLTEFAKFLQQFVRSPSADSVVAN
jgi:hypothetical protein